MTDRYERIRAALATGPTPGPWGLTELPRDMQRDGYKFSISRGGLGWWIAKVTHEANGGSGVANATYIAACDPDTIQALLTERDALREALEDIRSRSSINLAMPPHPFLLTARLGEIYQIADSALSKENSDARAALAKAEGR